MENKMTLRQFRERFNNGDFDSPDKNTQIEAGWKDWFCKEQELPERLTKTGEVINGITSDFILDNYHVVFTNLSTLNGSLFDEVKFDPVGIKEDDEKYKELAFSMEVGNTASGYKYAVAAPKNGYLSEMQTNYVNKVRSFINEWGNTKDREQNQSQVYEEPKIDRESARAAVKDAVGKVAYLSFTDSLEGYAEVLDVNDTTVSLQWVDEVSSNETDNKGYPPEVYTQPGDYQLKDLEDCDDVQKMNGKKVQKLRDAAMMNDKPMFDKFKTQTDVDDFPAGVASISVPEHISINS